MALPSGILSSCTMCVELSTNGTTWQDFSDYLTVITPDAVTRDTAEIGVFGEEVVEGERIETALFLEKRQLATGFSTIEVIVDDLPVRAGIDPRHLLIDRVPGDNVKKVSG